MFKIKEMIEEVEHTHRRNHACKKYGVNWKLIKWCMARKGIDWEFAQVFILYRLDNNDAKYIHALEIAKTNKDITEELSIWFRNRSQIDGVNLESKGVFELYYRECDGAWVQDDRSQIDKFDLYYMMAKSADGDEWCFVPDLNLKLDTKYTINGVVMIFDGVYLRAIKKEETAISPTTS